MVRTECGDSLSPLLACLEDSSSPAEDKTDAYLRLAEDLSKEDNEFLGEVCNISGRIISVLKRDIICDKHDLSQAALQAIGYCLYQEQIISSLQENEMVDIIEGICNVIMRSTDKNLCTRALWGLGKQHISSHLVMKKMPLILQSVENALLKFPSPTVQKEALEVIYRLIKQLPTESIASFAGQWCKLVYPLLISPALKIREKALSILEVGLQPILMARESIVGGLVSDLKGGMLADMSNYFSEKKEIFVLRAWTVLIAILREALHKSGSLINDMLKIPEQGFKSTLPNVQSISYNVWICLIDNFALSPAFIGSLKKVKLLMMPLLLCSARTVHKDIELARLQAWWHLLCTIKNNYTAAIFSEVFISFLRYYFNVHNEMCATPGKGVKGGMQLVLPVTPVARHETPTPTTPGRGRRKQSTLNKEKLPEEVVHQVMTLACEMLLEVLALDKTEYSRTKRLSEHLQGPILKPSFLQEHQLVILAAVKSAVRSTAGYLEETVSNSMWSSISDRITSLLKNGDSSDIDVTLSPLFITAHDLMTSSNLTPNLILKFLEILAKIPDKYLLHSFAILSPLCCQGKPVFLLADILFNQLASFKGSYVNERFHIVFARFIDVCLGAPTQQLNNVYTVWSSLESLISTVANVEDLWRFWSKVTDSVSEYVTKTSDVNQGDSLDHDFRLMVSLLSCPFTHLFSGGLPQATAKELDRDLADFFQLFSRCASLVTTAEANACIEQFASHLLNVISQEKYKNGNFLDAICNIINVMMDSVDFSALPTSSVRTNLSPAPKLKPPPRNLLGKLNSLVLLSAKVLTDAFEVDKSACGSSLVAPAVMVLTGALSKLFAHLNVPEQIKECIKILAKPLTLFISHHKAGVNMSEMRSVEKKSFNTKFFLKIEKLWTDMLTCIQSRYTGAYDTSFLETMTELLEATFCHCRRQFKNQTIMFWNATFAHSEYLDYPETLRPYLQTVLVKTPLTLPGWNKSKIPVFDAATTLQESEETTPKENIIKPHVVLANSPKRKHGVTSPGKLKGSFLHKAFSADKSALSPFKNVENSAAKRKSPGGGNVRRKLPLSLDAADDKDFVVIAPSPKKKRLLTEHQKEVFKEKKLVSVHPPLYNMLDQSQDGTRFAEWSQSLSQSTLSQIQENIEEAVVIPKDPVVKQVDSVMEQSSISPEHKHNDQEMDDIVQTITLDDNAVLLVQDTESPTRDGENSGEASVDAQMEESFSPEVIPSSQNSSLGENNNRRSIISFQSHCAKRFLPGACPDALNETREGQERDAEVDHGKKLEPTPEARKRTTRSSPISSRTRLRRRPSDVGSKSLRIKARKQAKQVFEATQDHIPDEDATQSEQPQSEQPQSEQLQSEQLQSEQPQSEQPQSEQPQSERPKSEQPDTQLFDTQILEIPEDVKRVKDTMPICETHDQADNPQMPATDVVEVGPSSPMRSVKLVHSKQSAAGSPLQRPARCFSSPAASPTTGILKRYKGNPDTPSPPGKTRRVSFAFPLREEKEFSSESLIDDGGDQNAKETEKKEQSYTSVKVTPTKPSTKDPSFNECIFPDLVECLTPVEQILPSLATSRWSRGLGHLVHAQNIRTIGNLSALSEEQVKKLPIRSPKVSTLRRVLRNFHDTRPGKSPKGNHQGEMKTIVEEDQLVENGVNNGAAAKGDDLSEQQDIHEEETREGGIESVEDGDAQDNIADKTIAEANAAKSLCDESELPFDAENMLTPRRSRSFAKPTNLFDAEANQRDGGLVDVQSAGIESNGNDDVLADDLADYLADCQSDVVCDGHTDEVPCATKPQPPSLVVPEPAEVIKCSDDATRSVEEVTTEKIDILEQHLPSSSGFTVQPSDFGKNDDCANNEMETEDVAPTEEGSHDMNVQSVVPQNDPFVAAVASLVQLKTPEELDQLPLSTLFSCHEHLTNVLSNVMISIKSKCK